MGNMAAMCRLLLIFGGLAMFVGAMSAAAARNTNRSPRQEGHRLALSKGDVCHVVASDQQYQPLLSHYAPSFYDVANRPNQLPDPLRHSSRTPMATRAWPYPELTPA